MAEFEKTEPVVVDEEHPGSYVKFLIQQNDQGGRSTVVEAQINRASGQNLRDQYDLDDVLTEQEQGRLTAMLQKVRRHLLTQKGFAQRGG